MDIFEQINDINTEEELNEFLNGVRDSIPTSKMTIDPKKRKEIDDWLKKNLVLTETAKKTIAEMHVRIESKKTRH